jgi:hypothetical protein
MEQQQSVEVRGIDTAGLVTKMGIGAVIGMAIICYFVFNVDHPDPAWGEYWRVRPLIVEPLAGAMGGVLIYLVNHLRTQNKMLIAFATIASYLGFVIAIWMGIVAGLHGTMWN